MAARLRPIAAPRRRNSRARRRNNRARVPTAGITACRRSRHRELALPGILMTHYFAPPNETAKAGPAGGLSGSGCAADNRFVFALASYLRDRPRLSAAAPG